MLIRHLRDLEHKAEHIKSLSSRLVDTEHLAINHAAVQTFYGAVDD